MPKYNAFISYRHASEMPLAVALDKALTKFAKPWNKLRALNIYRDVDSQALTANLLGAVEGAMENSDFIILLASPGSASSPWVPKEIAHWVKTRPLENLIIVVCDGEIEWDHEKGDFDWDKTTCLPDTLKGIFEGSPLYLDMRWAKGQEAELNLEHPQFKDNIARLSGTLKGKSKEDMLSEEVTQFRRTARIRNAAIATLSVLLVATVVAAAIAVHQRNAAIKTSLRIQVQNELDNNRLGRAIQVTSAAKERFGEDKQVRDMHWKLVSHPTAVINEFKGLESLFRKFSPDGERLMTGVRNPGGSLNLLVQDRLGGDEHHLEEVYAAHFFPDGSKLLLLKPSALRQTMIASRTPDGETVNSGCENRVQWNPANQAGGPQFSYMLTNGVARPWVYDFETRETTQWDGLWTGRSATVCGDFIRLFDESGVHQGDIRVPTAESVAISANGERLAVITDHGVAVMDHAGNRSALLPGRDPVISPDGSLVATVFNEGEFDYYDPATDDGQCVVMEEYLRHEEPWGEEPPGSIVDETCDVPEELGLAGQGSTRIYTASGEHITTLRGTHPSFAWGGVITIGGHEVNGFQDQRPQLWSLTPNAEGVHEKLIQFEGFEAVVSPDGEWIASGERGGESTWIWHRSGRFHARIDGADPVWVPGQAMLLTYRWGLTQIRDVERVRSESKEVVARIIDVPLTDMAVSDEFEFWRECGSDCEPGARYQVEIEGLKQPPSGATPGLSPTAIERETVVRITRRPEATFDAGNDGQITMVQHLVKGCDAQSRRYRDNLMLLACRSDGSWRIYDLDAESGFVDRDNHGAKMSGNHGSDLAQAGFSPDGNTVISVDEDGRALLWDISSGSAAETPVELNLGDWVWQFAFSPDSKLIVLMPLRGTARLWNAKGEMLAEMTLGDSREMFRGMRFFNDGRHLVFAGSDVRHFNFYTIWTTDPESLNASFDWVPRISGTELTR